MQPIATWYCLYITLFYSSKINNNNICLHCGAEKAKIRNCLTLSLIHLAGQWLAKYTTFHPQLCAPAWHVHAPVSDKVGLPVYSLPTLSTAPHKTNGQTDENGINRHSVSHIRAVLQDGRLINVPFLYCGHF